MFGEIYFQKVCEGLGWRASGTSRAKEQAHMEMEESAAGLPLAGVRVVEMTHMVMGPTCGMILAQLGAEVIKVELPAGDKTRSLGGMGTSFFPLFNRASAASCSTSPRPRTAR